MKSDSEMTDGGKVVEREMKMADSVPGGVYGNSGVLAHKIGLTEWMPGDEIPEHYIIDAVSSSESCKYCDALKAELDSYVERGILTYEIRRLSKNERLALYKRLRLEGSRACVPQFYLMDRRSDREQHIGDRHDAMAWLSVMYASSITDGIITSSGADEVQSP